MDARNPADEQARFERARELFVEGREAQQLGQLDEAESCYRQALELAPDRPSVMNNLAVVLIARDRHEDALPLCRRLVELDPNDDIAFTNLGVCEAGRDETAAALAAFESALRLNSRNIEALSNRAAALQKTGRLHAAICSANDALAIAPTHVGALNNRATILRNMGRHAEALEVLDCALKIDAQCAEALTNRGTMLADIGRHEDAISAFEKALLLSPRDDVALSGIASALFDANRITEAISRYEQALAVNPYCDYAPGRLLHAKLHIAKWDGFEELSRRTIAYAEQGRRADTPWSILSVCASPPTQRACAEVFVRHQCPAEPVWRGGRYGHKKIRIAYVSADFRNHPVAFLLAGVLRTHDRNRFEITAISLLHDKDSSMRQRLKPCFDRWIDAQYTPYEEIAALLRAHEIDIAVDLTGLTANCRPAVMALRGAPIQVSFLGYAGTMGVPYSDYIIADRVVIPPEDFDAYSENVVWLPDTFQPNDAARDVAERTPTREESGLPAQGFVFCGFNNGYKIQPPTFDVWMRILTRVERSVLWLRSANREFEHNLRHEAEARGVAPERLIFAPAVPNIGEHLARHRLAGLFLDTLPYNAHTTASDALWAGLPVLTVLGTTYAGRVAASLLHALGLPELVTRDYGEYEALAVRLASRPDELAALKAKLATHRTTHPLFDTVRYTRNLEAAYETMWERHERGEPPAPFAVERHP